MSDRPRLIDGIVLTKFDTIDDKVLQLFSCPPFPIVGTRVLIRGFAVLSRSQVGAAISMTYITGQPIVFVGTGQTYNDLRNLNARAVVGALMKA